MTAPTEDWRQERARVLAQARVVVVKVGSAVLTDAQGLSMPVLENLAGQLARLRNLLPAGDAASGGAGDAEPRRLVLVSSGAVAAGRAALATRESLSSFCASRTRFVPSINAILTMPSAATH